MMVGVMCLAIYILHLIYQAYKTKKYGILIVKAILLLIPAFVSYAYGGYFFGSNAAPIALSLAVGVEIYYL